MLSLAILSLRMLATVSAILFPLHVSGLTGPSSGGLNCTCSLWYSPPEKGIVYRHYIKILLVCRLSYRLLGVFLYIPMY